MNGRGNFAEVQFGLTQLAEWGKFPTCLCQFACGNAGKLETCLCQFTCANSGKFPTCLCQFACANAGKLETCPTQQPPTTS